MFIQDFVDEKAYVFNKTLQAKRIQFTINDGEPQPGIGNSDTYEWRINLFGCLYSEGNFIQLMQMHNSYIELISYRECMTVAWRSFYCVVPHICQLYYRINDRPFL